MALEDLHKDTSEADLWDLTDDPAGKPTPTPAAEPEIREIVESAPETEPETEPETDADGDTDGEFATPQPAGTEKPNTIPARKSERPGGGRNKSAGSGITTVTAKSRRPTESRISRSEPIAAARSDFDDLDDLDDWDTTATTPSGPDPIAPEDDLSETVDTADIPAPAPAIAPATDAPLPDEPAAAPPSPAAPSPAAPVASSLPTLRLSGVEKIGLASLLAVLVIAAAWFLTSTLSGLPRAVNPYQEPKLPARGELITVSRIDSHWRVPITGGGNADTVQRGTALMPILELTASGEDTAIRIQFRNSDGNAVGDPITRAIRGETELTIPSTAGLEDINTHNAYRTGLIEPWTAEILEAPSGTTAGGQFKTVLTVPISPNRRENDTP